MNRRLLATYLTITAFALALLAVPLGTMFAHREKDRLLFDIERDADGIASMVEGPVERGEPVPTRDITRYVARTGGHVIVVDAHGIALVDTEHPGTPRRNYSTRPEIRAALRGRRADGTRSSKTLGTSLVYAAVPTTGNGLVTGAVRITYPTATLDTRVREAWARLALLCIAVLAAAAIVGFVLARSISRPVRRLEEATDRVAAGDLSVRVDDAVGPPELRHLAATFNRMATRLARLIDAQHRFVADASHQLRTPLTALRLRLENLEARVDAAQRPAVDAAATEIARMSRLVDGLLALARSDSDGTGAEPVDVASVVRGRAEVWRDVADERTVRVAVDVPASSWALAAPGAVEQLVDNLVDNALAASPPGSSITLRVDRSPTGVEIHVLDEGPGLGGDARARAFDRFWRAPNATPGGSGLGLAIVRRLAEASGGSARLDPRDDVGLDAVVTLPAGPPS